MTSFLSLLSSCALRIIAVTAFCLSLVLLSLPAYSKTVVILDDDDLEIHYGSGVYNITDDEDGVTEIDIRDVELYDKGATTLFGTIGWFKLKAIGPIDDLDDFLITQLSIHDLEIFSDDIGKTPFFLTIAKIEGKNLFYSQSNRVANLIQNKSINGDLLTSFNINQVKLTAEEENVLVTLDSFEASGLFYPFVFDDYPNSNTDQFKLKALTIQPLNANLLGNNAQAFMAEFGMNKLLINIDSQRQSRKSGDNLNASGSSNIDIDNLFSVSASITSQMSRAEYNQTIELSADINEDNWLQSDIIDTVLHSFIDLKIVLRDKGILDLYERVRVQKNLPDVSTISVIANSFISSQIPIHAPSVNAAINDFLRKGGQLSISASLIPPLMFQEILDMKNDPDQLMDRINLQIRQDY